MISWLKKHKHTLLICIAVVFSLTAAYFWGGKPRGSSPVTTGMAEPFSSDRKESEAYETEITSKTPASSVVVSENTSERSGTKSEISESVISSSQNSNQRSRSSSVSSDNAVVPSDSGTEAKAPAEESIHQSAEEDSVSVSVPEISGVSSENEEAPPESVTPPQSSHNETETDSEDDCRCVISVSCKNLLDKASQLKKNKRSIIPEDGIILEAYEVSFEEGENVFDLTKRVCQEKKIPFEFTLTPFYQTAYIEGIANLYEFDCGSGSGWVFVVNNVIPGYGCSQYRLKKGDIIEWVYTCDLGHDVEEELGRR